MSVCMAKLQSKLVENLVETIDIEHRELTPRILAIIIAHWMVDNNIRFATTDLVNGQPKE